MSDIEQDWVYRLAVENDQFVTITIADQLFGITIALRGIDDVEAGIQGFVEEAADCLFRDVRKADFRTAKTKDAYIHIRSAKSALLHENLLSGSRCLLQTSPHYALRLRGLSISVARLPVRSAPPRQRPSCSRTAVHVPVDGTF